MTPAICILCRLNCCQPQHTLLPPNSETRIPCPQPQIPSPRF
jgi:hypothetical protein